MGAINSNRKPIMVMCSARKCDPDVKRKVDKPEVGPTPQPIHCAQACDEDIPIITQDELQRRIAKSND